VDGDGCVREGALDLVDVEIDGLDELGLPAVRELVLREDLFLEDQEDVLVPLQGLQRVGEASKL
jgi:hypothetical protein